MAAQFKVMKGRFLARTQSVDGARHQFLPGAGFPQDQHGRIGRRNHFHLPHEPASGRAAADDLLESCACLGTPRRSVSTRSRSRRSCTKVIHRNGESFNTARGHQNRDAGPILANQLFFKGVQAPNRQAFFMRQLIQRRDIPAE